MMSNYPLTWGHTEQDFFQNRAKKTDLKLILLDDHESVLEIGCGIGTLLGRLSKKYTNSKFYGLDTSAEAIEFAKKTIQGDHIHFIQGTAESLPFKDQTFEKVFFQTLMMYIANPEESIREMVRVTKVGGKVIALAEGDWSNFYCNPPNQGMEFLVQFFLKNISAPGGNPYVGGKMVALFQKSGLDRVSSMVHDDPNNKVSGKQMMTSDYLLMAASFLKSTQVRGTKLGFEPAMILKEIREWCQIPGSYLTMPRSIYTEGYRNV